MEVTWKLGNTYLKIQDCESGWNFTILDLFIFINWCRIGRSNEIRYRNLRANFMYFQLKYRRWLNADS